MNCGKILQEIPDHLTCVLRNLDADQEKTVRIRHETSDWFKTGKGVNQGCILSPCIFNFYAKYILRSARLNEPQGGIKIAGRNINNLRYADDTTLIAESEEELKGLFTRVKESEKTVLKLNTQKLRSRHPSPTLHGKQVGKKWNQWKISLGPKITVDNDCSHEIKRCLLLGRKATTNLDGDITLPTKIHIIKAMVFLVVIYGCDSWAIKKAEH